MWLLNTARAELKFFSTPESVPGGYAILSHVWDALEQTFQDLKALRAQCASDGTNPRDLVCDKIRNFCILAEHGGHEWAWADMCCIDKTSSTELSEAIASMYRYYSLADVCYVYLRDVPTASQRDLHAPKSNFRESRWHRRGWTLQELIASPFVIFLSGTWQLLGAKADLADLLEEITRVPAAVLKLEVHPSAYCVATRMSWAMRRQTTRPEDEAYCLMGIFGIFMPPLYGEGRNAFLRLQEEIMRQVDDSSIFAWGYISAWSTGGMSMLTSSAFEDEEMRGFGRSTLFARSPSDFFIGRCTKRRVEHGLYELGRWSFSADLSKLPTFSVTPYGVMAHLPVFQLTKNNETGSVLLALLLGIELVSGYTTQNIGLLLRKTDSPDHTRQLYVPCSHRVGRESTRRLFGVEKDSVRTAAGTKITLEWRTVYIVRRPPIADPLGLQVVGRSLRTPFYIPKSEIAAWKSVASYSLDPPDPTESSWRRHVALKIDLSVSESTPASTVVIYFGLCTRSPLDGPKHWAMIAEYPRLEQRSELCLKPQPELQHVCAQHHVDEKPTQIHPLTIYNAIYHDERTTGHGCMAFSDAEMRLKLSFSLHGLSLTRCHKVAIRFNPKEYKSDIDGEDDELMDSSDCEEHDGEWAAATMKGDWY